MLRQPFESALAFERFAQRFAGAIVSQIEGTSSVVLTITGGGIFAEDLNQLASGLKFPSDDLLLPADAPKS